MTHSQYGALRVGAKTAEVVDYHRAAGQPGKPLHMLIPGGVISLASLALMIWVAWLTWHQASLSEGRGLTYLLVLLPVYAGGVFLFSYAYELYDVPRALRLTAILVFVSVAAVIILAVLFALLGKRDSGSGTSGSSSGSRSGSNRGSIDVDLSGSPTVTREVIREAPADPIPLLCSYCGASYAPPEGARRCPSCGASQPVAAHLEAAGGNP